MALDSELVLRAPDPRLRGLVRGYQGFREWSGVPLRLREVPTGDVVVIVDLGPGWRIGAAGDPLRRYGSFTSGLDDRPWFVEHDGEACGMQLDLTPLGARTLLGVPLCELARCAVALEDVLGAEAARLEERLHGASGWEERFALVDRALAARAAEAEPVRADVAWAWRRLVETDGGLRVESLVAELGCSRRHLAARFGHELGLAPKTFARVLRFRRAADLLLAGGDRRLAEIAALCGYFDQAHFNRDFRAFAGATPTELLASRLPHGRGVAA